MVLLAGCDVGRMMIVVTTMAMITMMLKNIDVVDVVRQPWGRWEGVFLWAGMFR